MRRTVPLLIAAICGIVLIVTAFIPATVSWGETAAVWFDILAAIAFILGGGNLLKIHLRRVSDQSEGWAYSLITVVTFLLTLGVGLFKLGISPGSDQEFYGETFAHLTVEQMPEELTFDLPVSLAAELLDEEIPASVRQQFSVKIEDKTVTQLRFRGWMNGGQRQDLLNLHQKLDWQCAIEQLADLAAIPDQLAGEVRYLPDHRALSVSGSLNEEEETFLRNISDSQSWQRATDRLVERSRAVTSYPISTPPESFLVPQSYEDRIILTENNIDVIGPVGPEMKTALVDVFPRTRPFTEEQVQQYVDELAALPGGLTDVQKNTTAGLLKSDWTADQLIAALNDAGVRQERTKSACELLAEMQAGEKNLQLTVPPTEPDVTLNAAQEDYIQQTVSNSDSDLSAMGQTLSTLGDWLSAQEAALQSFLQKTPTIPMRNRLIASALITGGETLSEEQFEFLLAGYREQHNWQEQMYGLMVKSHQVKYPWSGEYIAVGSPFWWSYEYAFKPLTATMFSLLAFYVASAAFRAFRAKNFEALLLLGTAFIILLGRTFAGVMLTSGLPESLSAFRLENITMFIMSIINTAGNRAIMIGISLGIVSTSLKILLGVDRSYLGSGDE
ncbi:hypothetical protein [uncultured Rubinisphaera sp.]|uniref:hypothetical protein n=1 Tax=uncultured Rubinisphaera sp. TaxID=1678686 RepID=UPI0030D71C7B